MRSPVNREPPAPATGWQHELSNAFRTLGELLKFLEMDTPDDEHAELSDSPFPFKVTRSYADRMRKQDPLDPLFLQVFPDKLEKQDDPQYVSDPVGDMASLVAPGLIHKYEGRVLLVTTGACAIHCRYCFRREFSYGDFHLSRQWEARAIDYVRSDTDIKEVILSGGDPLVLSDHRLHELIDQFAQIPHLRRIRIHSRLPVVLPSRITDTFLETLSQCHVPVILVIHANHANEISADVRLALTALSDAGATLLNQAVLLRRVNDSVSALCDLSEALFDSGVMPYYLHLLDKVSGSRHFDIPKELALDLYDQLRRQLPGYLVPRLVRENEGQPYKSLLGTVSN